MSNFYNIDSSYLQSMGIAPLPSITPAPWNHAIFEELSNLPGCSGNKYLQNVFRGGPPDGSAQCEQDVKGMKYDFDLDGEFEATDKEYMPGAQYYNCQCNADFTCVKQAFRIAYTIKQLRDSGDNSPVFFHCKHVPTVPESLLLLLLQS